MAKNIYPRIGAHISAAGDISQAPLRAAEIGLECFQFFSRSPQGGPAKPITDQLVEEFQTNCRKHGLESYIHSPYYINLASADSRIYYGSIRVLREELERGSRLGVKYLMMHLGSAKDLGEKKGVEKAIDGLDKILAGYNGVTKFLIEMSAGAGAVIGDTFEEIAGIIFSAKLKKYKIGICYDTAHGFASGYDLRTEQAVRETFKQFDKILDLKNLCLIHANDSLADFGSHKDRHENIGKGKIGLAGFKALVAFAQKQKVNLVLETPHESYKDKALLEDIKILKELRK